MTRCYCESGEKKYCKNYLLIFQNPHNFFNFFKFFNFSKLLKNERNVTNFEYVFVTRVHKLSVLVSLSIIVPPYTYFLSWKKKYSHIFYWTNWEYFYNSSLIICLFEGPESRTGRTLGNPYKYCPSGKVTR